MLRALARFVIARHIHAYIHTYKVYKLPHKINLFLQWQQLLTCLLTYRLSFLLPVVTWFGIQTSLCLQKCQFVIELTWKECWSMHGRLDYRSFKIVSIDCISLKTCKWGPHLALGGHQFAPVDTRCGPVNASLSCSYIKGFLTNAKGCCQLVIPGPKNIVAFK